LPRFKLPNWSKTTGAPIGQEGCASCCARIPRCLSCRRVCAGSCSSSVRRLTSARGASVRLAPWPLLMRGPRAWPIPPLRASALPLPRDALEALRRWCGTVARSTRQNARQRPSAMRSWWRDLEADDLAAGGQLEAHHFDAFRTLPLLVLRLRSAKATSRNHAAPRGKQPGRRCSFAADLQQSPALQSQYTVATLSDSDCMVSVVAVVRRGAE